MVASWAVVILKVQRFNNPSLRSMWILQVCDWTMFSVAQILSPLLGWNMCAKSGVKFYCVESKTLFFLTGTNVRMALSP